MSDSEPTTRKPPHTPDDGATVITAAPGNNVPKGMDGEVAVLPVGSRLAEFEITGLIGQGGFGAVYEAHDHALERTVAIKEYLPVSLSIRQSDGSVQPVSQRQRETFELGMRSFINEARLLAQFDHPSLLKVYRFWQERGTAYMVMPFYRGPTLRQALTAMPNGARQDLLLHIVDDLTQALAIMHRANCYHRDIAPDNILLLEGSGRPVLLDFGAARRVISDKTQSITTILKPGYAPIEQYAEMPGMSQGAWTDIYALSAVLHVAITGYMPPPSIARLVADAYAPLAGNPQLRRRFDARLLEAIDAGLAVRPETRPQSIAAFRRLLGLEKETPDTILIPPSTASVSPVSSQSKKSSSASSASSSASSAKPSKPAAATIATAAGNGKTLLHGIYRTAALPALALVLFAAGLGWWLWNSKEPEVSGEKTTTASGTPPINTPGTPGTPGTPEKPDTLGTPDTPKTGESVLPLKPDTKTLEGQPPGHDAKKDEPPPEPPQKPPPQPRTPAQSLAALSESATEGFEVSAVPRQPSVRIGKDKLTFNVRSSRAGYVYVYLLSSDGKLTLLFPNLLDKYNRLQAGQTLTLPRPAWPLEAAGPQGTDRFAVLVSEHERDFTNTGLSSIDIFSEFSLPVLAALEMMRGDGPTPLLGKPVCAPNVPCQDAYGVGRFEIDER